MAIIYGVDDSQPITTQMVRDAIFVCFKQAHEEVLNLTDEFMQWKSAEEREVFRTLEIEVYIKNAFKENGASFDNPTKEDLLHVTASLSQIALKFRNPEIVKKHYEEIMALINKLPTS